MKTEMIKSIVLLMLLIIPVNKSRSEPTFDSALAVADPELIWNAPKVYISKADEEQHLDFKKSPAVIPEALQSREHKKKRRKVAPGEFYQA